MAARTWVTLAALLLVGAALAGCTKPDEGANDDDPQTVPAPGGNANPGSNGATPTDFELADEGAIQGPFEKSWDILVANVAFRDAHVTFSLAPLQAGAPATALVHLTLYDPHGAPLQSATVGLGAESDTAEWTLTPADLSSPGTYTLRAAAASDSPLPSAGFAAYSLTAHVSY